MSKYVCKVCGYVHEGDEPPAQCPVCKVPGSMFEKVEGEMKLAAENLEKVGSSKTASKNIRVSPRKAMPVTKQASTNDDSCLFY